MGKPKRRIFSGILALALCLTCLTLPAFAQSHEPKDEVMPTTMTPNTPSGDMKIFPSCPGAGRW